MIEDSFLPAVSPLLLNCSELITRQRLLLILSGRCQIIVILWFLKIGTLNL
jgi:hypothetical protein